MKTNIKILIILSFLLLSVFNPVKAQQNSDYEYLPISLASFLSNVSSGNLGYVSEKLSVNISEAELRMSHIFPDPEVSFAYSNNEDKTLMMGQSYEAGLSYSVNTANKRKAGISVARSQYELTLLVVDSYFRNLRADAALEYFKCLYDFEKYSIQKSICDQLNKLAASDSLRYIKGDATRLDAMQSSLEAKIQHNVLVGFLAEMQNSSIRLMSLQGKISFDTLLSPSDGFPVRQTSFNPERLIDEAVKNRSDLLIAIKEREVSEKYLDLIKAERAFEFNLEGAYSYNSVVRNDIAPAPAYNGLSVGVSVPLKFSSLNQGSVRAASSEMIRRNEVVKNTELLISTEVLQAYNSFISSVKKVEHFSTGLADDAGKILDGRVKAYQQGETGLNEVITAQRTFMDLKLQQLEALFDYSNKLIELERSTGIWDLGM